MKKIMFCTLFLCFCYFSSFAQEKLENDQVNLFIDCESCDQIYIRQELPQFNYVRRLEGADVQIRSTRIENGSGGYRHNIFFIGHNRFLSHDQELFFIENADMSFEEKRQGILNIIKSGLVPYVAYVSPSNEIEINFPESIQSTAWDATRWQNWTLLLGGNINFSSSNSTPYRWDLDPRFAIAKETPTEQFGLQYFFSLDRFENQAGTEITNYYHQMFGYYATAIKPKWSVGGSVFGRLSKVGNQPSNKTLNISPMIEYSIWPYAVFHKKRMTVRYMTSINQDARVTGHGPEVRLALFKKWGFISGTYRLSHSFIKNSPDILSTQLAGSIWIRLSNGFYVSFNTNLFGNIRLQESINPNSSSQFSVSFNYIMGDIYNNVVNPRLGF
jgi:hypothetical protein